ncbi:uncharacterized protein PHACADRAFT_128256 [Phanerochaete carnosa HHB-10118-sp]|uniref:AttH domain-containing protein n=1 Tax=Phanerochaete carnosa (strain HHB-10118-sp) TaxID=650164 RepID=K5UQH9_PHACS|nr:uncharacterized protein PHACADRAFT_128256 [Phanerochaete carnosa HHB-10118-sp]EKM52086.1 hypothetical protein PHACADRAFT_128256 [Phanerochaete carnosa HHB-10118-sp]
MRLLWSVLFSQILAVVTAQRSPISLDIISGAPSQGQSNVQLTSSTLGFDAPKTLPINGSSFDWWYFDVVSEDLDYSLVLVFFAATANGLWKGLPELPASVWVDGQISAPDGPAHNFIADSNDLIVMTMANGSSGTLNGTGWGWAGLPDMSYYELIIDDPEAGVQGTVTFESTTPAQFPCASITAPGEQSFILGSAPFGWANALPDANANVDVVINGTRIKFSGAGYHDKNWGPSAVGTVVKSWYWGHARLGPLVVVWFDVISPDGSEHVSSYVSRNSEVLTASCSNMTVRATGANSTWPPVRGTGAPGGFHISASVEGEGQLEIDVKHKTLLTADPDVTIYRWTGSVSGGFGNGTTWTGPALYEMFAF